MKYIITVTAIIYGVLLFTGNAASSSPKNLLPVQSPGEGKSIALVGDLQRTSLWELVLGREQNDPERELIVNSIADDNPSMVVLLGDMVFDGSSEFQWQYFDSLLAPIRSKDIQVFPVVGNHEYWGKSKSSLRLLNKRFPIVKQKSWYAMTHDSLALIFLNSNQIELSSAEWDEQIAWYNNRIYNFETDPSIKGILVFTHHPPYTNSTITGDEEHVQDAFLPAFNNASKTTAFFSGHAHTYERFKIHGKMFLVSGGGGGPRAPLKFGLECHEDLCKEDSPRPFNYLLVERTGEGINIKVKALKKNTTSFYMLEEFLIPVNMNFSITGTYNK